MHSVGRTTMGRHVSIYWIELVNTIVTSYTITVPWANTTLPLSQLPFITKKLRSCKDWVDRKICHEAIEIKYRRPVINTQHSKMNKVKKSNNYEIDNWKLL